MRLMRYRPNRGVSGLHQEMDRFLENILPASVTHDGIFAGHLAPPVDIYETGEELVIKAELPGVDKEDIKLSITDNVLILKGEKKISRAVDEENYHRIERVYGSFYRSVELPSRVKAEGIEARFENGVLEIRVPKAEEVKVKEIEIKLPE